MRRPKSLFPRRLAPMPATSGPGAGIQRMLAERRELARLEMRKAEGKRLLEVRRAFAEGMRAGAEWEFVDVAWERSAARRGLEPVLSRPGDAIRKLQLERARMAEPALSERYHARRQLIRHAFEEGHWWGSCGHPGAEAWLYSRTRRLLYPGPPTPPHLSALLVSRGFRVDDLRRGGGPG